ncbi:MAG: hypothetical protein JWN64_580 [Parcubacteria group bacterium]|nr:hypothetical protein [Parcubacteria group bacterium]
MSHITQEGLKKSVDKVKLGISADYTVYMSMEHGGTLNHGENLNREKRHPTREEYEAKVVADLEQQFKTIRENLNNGKRGISKYLTGYAYDRLLELEEKKHIPADIAERLRDEADKFFDELGEKAA